MNREFSESKSNGIVNWSFIGERLAVRHKRELSNVIEEWVEEWIEECIEERIKERIEELIRNQTKIYDPSCCSNVKFGKFSKTFQSDEYSSRGLRGGQLAYL